MKNRLERKKGVTSTVQFDPELEDKLDEIEDHVKEIENKGETRDEVI